jgi:hypothetical protein
MLQCNTNVTKCNTEIEIEKDIEIDIKEKKKRKFQPPTLEEIKQYILEKGLKVNAEQFYNYFTEGNWIDAKGNKVKNWKQKLLTWNKYQVDVKEEKKTNYNNYDQRQYDNMEKFYANKL